MQNKYYRTRARSEVKSARQIMQDGERDSAVEVVHQAISSLDQAASKGVIHRKNAARRKSRLMKRLAKME